VTRIVLTLGDPRGIGPEVVAAAARVHVERVPDVDLLLVGPAGADPGVADYLPVDPFDGSEAGAGKVAAATIRAAVATCLDGDADGIVTGPIHKPALRAAGVSVAGHTEWLRELAGAEEVGMLMAAEATRAGGALRVLLATTHLPLREVPDRVTPELLVRQTKLLHQALVAEWQIQSPRIGLCALNPHASDQGLFGDEEERVFRPAVQRLADAGLEVRGPLPADTVFRRALDGDLDAVVAPYHDVGMAAFKTVSFGRGVNVTLGLPFVRTSPDHGTAFDIAGRGLADPASTSAALELAVRLARGRARPDASTPRFGGLGDP
jgi:4-hydroxythreonine-4-phosphate dehydrogenase